MNFSYFFDLYYGKSSNKRPLNKDVLIDGQNYDLQNFFELALNRGQETFSITTDDGLVRASTSLFGYGCFWLSNNMHDAISWPPPPVEPKPAVESDYEDEQDFLIAEVNYNEQMEKYERDLKDYKLSREITNKTKFKDPWFKRIFMTKPSQIVPNPTFHWLYSLYDNDNRIDWSRWLRYYNAKQAQDIYFEQRGNIEENEK
ncbi:hypothetical protein [Capnocytophaga canimorsus]|uniref:hypothetical protein n=1 Tax=Capnocytophaga canimorsus TaxID=28188 RepID=UPI000F4E89A7|nr:hypothetical protein [Capnocytophaga canimorsus]AYW36317.1 hypothetical protein D8L92_02635 [Capnocytophaga canimorsus]